MGAPQQVGRAEAVQAMQAFGTRAAEGEPRPPCVCGSHLAHVTYRERLKRYILMRMPSLASRPEDLQRFVELNLLHGESCYYCDICGNSRSEGGLWTCENANNTVLHANAYDVCGP